MFTENYMACEQVYCSPRVWCSQRTTWHVNRCTVLPKSDVHRELHGMWTGVLFSPSVMFRENYMSCEQVYCSPRVWCSQRTTWHVNRCTVLPESDVHRELHGMWTGVLFSPSLMFTENYMACEQVYCSPRVWCSQRTTWHVNRCTVFPESDVHRELHGMWTGVLFSPSLMFRENYMVCEQVYCSPWVWCSEITKWYVNRCTVLPESDVHRELHGMWTGVLFSPSLMFRENYMICEQVYCSPQVWCSQRTTWHVNKCTVLPESDVQRELHGMWTGVLFSLSLMFRENYMICEQVYCSPQVWCSQRTTWRVNKCTVLPESDVQRELHGMWTGVLFSLSLMFTENYMVCEQVYCSPRVWCSQRTTWHVNRCTVFPESDVQRELHGMWTGVLFSPSLMFRDNQMVCEQVYCSPRVWCSQRTTWHVNRSTVFPESDVQRELHDMWTGVLFSPSLMFTENYMACEQVHCSPRVWCSERTTWHVNRCTVFPESDVQRELHGMWTGVLFSPSVMFRENYMACEQVYCSPWVWCEQTVFPESDVQRELHGMWTGALFSLSLMFRENYMACEQVYCSPRVWCSQTVFPESDVQRELHGMWTGVLFSPSLMFTENYMACEQVYCMCFANKVTVRQIRYFQKLRSYATQSLWVGVSPLPLPPHLLRYTNIIALLYFRNVQHCQMVLWKWSYAWWTASICISIALVQQNPNWKLQQNNLGHALVHQSNIRCTNQGSRTTIKHRMEGRKEMFYLTIHSTHFIYMASDIW